MNKKVNFILRSLVFLIGFVLLVILASQLAHVMVERGWNTIIAAIPLSMMFFGLGVWFIE